MLITLPPRYADKNSFLSPAAFADDSLRLAASSFFTASTVRCISACMLVSVRDTGEHFKVAVACKIEDCYEQQYNKLHD